MASVCSSQSGQEKLRCVSRRWKPTFIPRMPKTYIPTARTTTPDQLKNQGKRANAASRWQKMNPTNASIFNFIEWSPLSLPVVPRQFQVRSLGASSHLPGASMLGLARFLFDLRSLFEESERDAPKPG